MAFDSIETFKNRHKNKTAIVFGTGPSLFRYDGRFNHGSILVGTNEIIYYNQLMHYYFIGDGGDHTRGYWSDPDAYDNYQPIIQKFYRNCDPNARIKCSHVRKNVPGVIYYNVIQKTGFRFFNTVPPFSDALSISFEALQFCLLAGFSKIYLIGHDCDYTNGTIKANNVSNITINHAKFIIGSWFMFERFVKARYPKLEIINVNPVKMRLFNIVET